MIRAAAAAGALVCLAVAQSAGAQALPLPLASAEPLSIGPVKLAEAARPATQSAGGSSSRWEIEGAIGVGSGYFSSGSTALPGPGQPIETSSPTFPSRQTSSWLFGDGASLLNSVNAQFGLSAQVQPLDAALQGLGLKSTGVTGSFRVRRWFTTRVAAEFSLDLIAESATLSDSLVASANATRDSAKAALTALLASGPLTNVVVDATSATTPGSNHELAATGALVWSLRDHSDWTPYVTAGAGLLTGFGDLPSITVQDTYRFTILGTVPIAETDHVLLHYDRTKSAIVLLGGGLRRDVGAGWGWRVDGRVFIAGQTPRLLLDATPTVTTGSPPGFIESFTNPAIQFSNNSSTGRQSTLSATIQGFEAVSPGTETRVLVTFNVFKRF